MTQQELLRWWELLTNKDYKNKFIAFESDYRELIQLNHQVMEQAHEIHNNNMQRKGLNMTRQEEMTFVLKYSEKILELIDQVEITTRSDVQGGADAIVMMIIHELKKQSIGKESSPSY